MEKALAKQQDLDRKHNKGAFGGNYEAKTFGRLSHYFLTASQPFIEFLKRIIEQTNSQLNFSTLGIKDLCNKEWLGDVGIRDLHKTLEPLINGAKESIVVSMYRITLWTSFLPTLHYGQVFIRQPAIISQFL